MPILKKLIIKTFVFILLFAYMVLYTAILEAGGRRKDILFPPAPSAAALGRGGNSVASEGVGFFGSNPASLGRTGTMSFYGEYATVNSGAINPAFGIAFPTSSWVIGVLADYYGPLSDLSEETVIGRTWVGAARELYPGFLVGASLYSAAHEVDERGSAYGGIQVGSIFSYFPGGSGNSGLGFHRLSLGASLRMGNGPGDEEMIRGHDQFLAGYRLQFYRHSDFNLLLYNEIGSLWGIDSYCIRTGLEFEYRELIVLRSGFITPQGYQYSGFTAGAGILFEALDLSGSIDYAWAYNRDFGSTHSLGITAALTSPDTTPPRTRVTAAFTGFSPNSDAVQDYMVFSLRVRDESEIRGWRFQILDSRGRVIKEFRHHRRERRRGISPSALAGALFEGRESRVVPSGITWDGIDDNGKVFPDGEYFYAFTAWDAFDNITPARKGRFIIDTVRPDVSVKALRSRLNPDAGGIIEIEQKIREKNDDIVTVELIQENGESVRRFTWLSREAPQTFTWNGLNEKGKPVQHGRYYYKISVKDPSGNSVTREINNLILEPRDYPVDLISSVDYYSSSSGSPLVFTAHTDKIQMAGTWKLHITDEGGDAIRIFEGTGVPSRIAWDGLMEGGRRTPDARYLYFLHIMDKDGTTIESPRKMITLDSSPPAVRLASGSSVFSPDGDFHEDFVRFAARASSASGVARWELNIYSGTGGIYYKKSGVDEVPSKILWGGRGFDGSLPFSMEKFSAELVVFDRAGNGKVSAKKEISTDILVVPRRDILSITLIDTSNPDHFASDRRFNSILGRLAGVLSSYPDYRIDIEVHTDFEGDDHLNLTLSEKKALYVRDFLAGKGLGDRIMNFRGMGETTPLFGQDAGKDRMKNNRVEILLSPGVY